MSTKSSIGLILMTVMCGARSWALTPEQEASLPPAASRTIHFSNDIKPILETSCIKCHGRGKSKGGFKLDNRDELLKGGDSGPAILPGKSLESYLIELVAGVDPDNVMPQKGSKLTAVQVGLLRAWVDQGAPWDEGVSFAKLPAINLKTRRPAVPSSSKPAQLSHPIDAILEPYFAAHQITPSKVVDDRVFARRVYLDIIGLLPTPDELDDFAADSNPAKRRQLVKRLLADSSRYAEHWLTFWNDILRNDYKGTGYIDGGRKQITEWLYVALAKNLPYDEFVRQLIDPTPESEGFAKGIVWRGVINASQTPPMQAAQNISQIFMGVNLKCASCHDSFINDWSLADAYGLASIYSDEKLEMVQCDKPTGHMAEMKFIYPELGAIDAKAPKKERMKQLAGIITQKQNGRLTRTIVNRLWAKFMGRGLVEPVDEMESPAWNPDLLDWLAEDLSDHGFDLKTTIERICTSQAYQLPSVPASEQTQKNYVFRGPSVRRMTAEQYLDALASVSGASYSLPVARADFTAGIPKAPIPDRSLDPYWIWSTSDAAEKASPATVYFRKSITLREVPTAASAVITCDNSFKLFINGKEVASGRDHTKPNVIDLLPHLRAGKNLFAVSAVNDKSKADQDQGDPGNPAGLIFHARVRHEATAPVGLGRKATPSTRRIQVETVLDFSTDSSWVWSAEKLEGWETPEFDASGWKPATVLGPPAMAPWNLGQKLTEALSASALYGRTRAALVHADPLMVALGRPNREQVITARSSAATTLQALELTNGPTLAEHLKRGAEKLIATAPPGSRDLIALIFQRALGRNPTPDEFAVSEELLSPPQKDGIEDLLWSLAMLPEFQLIY